MVQKNGWNIFCKRIFRTKLGWSIHVGHKDFDIIFIYIYWVNTCERKYIKLTILFNLGAYELRFILFHESRICNYLGGSRSSCHYLRNLNPIHSYCSERYFVKFRVCRIDPKAFSIRRWVGRIDPSLARWNIGSLVVNRNDKLASFVYTFLCLYR